VFVGATGAGQLGRLTSRGVTLRRRAKKTNWQSTTTPRITILERSRKYILVERMLQW
jgi:hypothetical protein